MPYERAEAIAIVAGTTPPARQLRLSAQNITIRSITLDNPTNITALLYLSTTGPNGNPLSIPPYTYRTVPVALIASAYLAFSGVPIANGVIYLHYSDATQSASFGASQVAQTSSYPLGATPFGAVDGGSWGPGLPPGGTNILLLNLTPMGFVIGQSVYITSFSVYGMEDQRFAWQAILLDQDGVTPVVNATVTTSYSGKDKNITWPIPKRLGAFAKAGSSACIQIQPAHPTDNIVGVLTFDTDFSGYVL